MSIYVWDGDIATDHIDISVCRMMGTTPAERRDYRNKRERCRARRDDYKYQRPLEITNVADPELPKDGIIMRVRATGFAAATGTHGWPLC